MKIGPSYFWRTWACLMGLAAAVPGQAALVLYRTAESVNDLAISGQLAGVESGQMRWLRWRDLRSLPVETLLLNGEFVPGKQRVTVVFLSTLWENLPLARTADTILATCTDGYAAVYRLRFISQYRPFIILEINGDGPEKWPPAGLNYNPGPYVISFDSHLVPRAPPFLDAQHKRPWGVNRLEFANFADRFRNLYEGPWAHLSSAAKSGREIWVNSCASCHSGPGGAFGGSKSGLLFDLVASVAKNNRDFFKRYIRNPQATLPGAKMEAHAYYTDEQLEALIAFVTAQPTH